MNLNAWAIKHGISFEAVDDLRRQMQGVSTEPKHRGVGLSEAAVQTNTEGLSHMAQQCRCGYGRQRQSHVALWSMQRLSKNE